MEQHDSKNVNQKETPPHIESHNMSLVAQNDTHFKPSSPSYSPASSPVYLTLEALASRLFVSHATIHRLLKKGLPSIKLGKQRRFELDKVIGWLERHT
jgi:excisionase family DNA binding protein